MKPRGRPHRLQRLRCRPGNLGLRLFLSIRAFLAIDFPYPLVGVLIDHDRNLSPEWEAHRP